MRLIIEDDARAVGLTAASLVGDALAARPGLVLALPTGESPTGLYAELVRRHREERLSFARASTFNLDEYLGLAATAPQSCRAFMEAHLFGAVDLPRAHIHFLDGLADPIAECARYQHAIAAAGGLDLAILGIGANGHVGFNEPGTPLDGRTAQLALAERTLVDNARLLPPGTVLPRFGLSMGMGTIGEARALLLIAFGPRKASAIRDALRGPVSPACPASAIQRHPEVAVLVDRAAASLL